LDTIPFHGWVYRPTSKAYCLIAGFISTLRPFDKLRACFDFAQHERKLRAGKLNDHRNLQ
jgi:hypothetical protein